MRYYLAYGSNLNLRQMKWRCPEAKPVGIAYLEGYELLFKGSKTGSYLTIEKKKGSKVPVGVWKVNGLDEAALDRYEGYPSFYYKKEIEIELGDKKGTAFVYIMHEDRPVGVPSQAYVETCREGYIDFGFDIKYLEDALNKSMEVTNGSKD